MKDVFTVQQYLTSKTGKKAIKEMIYLIKMYIVS